MSPELAGGFFTTKPPGETLTFIYVYYIYKYIIYIYIYNFFIFIFSFNWRIIALQCCVGFCHTIT